MAITRNRVQLDKFNKHAKLPYQLRLQDFQMALQDVYDFFFDVNAYLVKKGLQRLTTCAGQQLCLAFFRTCSLLAWPSILAC